jgi:hypothetical protein
MSPQAQEVLQQLGQGVDRFTDTRASMLVVKGIQANTSGGFDLVSYVRIAA